MSVRKVPQNTEQSWAVTRAQDTRRPAAMPECPDCGETRRTFEALPAHRVLAHGNPSEQKR